MLNKVKIIGFALAMLTSPLVLAQSFTAGQRSLQTMVVTAVTSISALRAELFVTR